MGPDNDNLVELQLVRLQLDTQGAGAADLILQAALAENGQYTPGNSNQLRVLMTSVTGSGPRANSYADEVGQAGPQTLGTGNRLIFDGNLNAFMRRNDDIVPAPAAEFFGAGR